MVHRGAPPQPFSPQQNNKSLAPALDHLIGSQTSPELSFDLAIPKILPSERQTRQSVQLLLWLSGGTIVLFPPVEL